MNDFNKGDFITVLHKKSHLRGDCISHVTVKYSDKTGLDFLELSDGSFLQLNSANKGIFPSYFKGHLSIEEVADKVKDHVLKRTITKGW